MQKISFVISCARSNAYLFCYSSLFIIIRPLVYGIPLLMLPLVSGPPTPLFSINVCFFTCSLCHRAYSGERILHPLMCKVANTWSQSYVLLSPHTEILTHLAGSVHVLSIQFLPFGLLPNNSGLVTPFHCSRSLQAAIFFKPRCIHVRSTVSSPSLVAQQCPNPFSHCWAMVVVIYRGPFLLP